ncbi:transcriptional regulator with XRE-family HTH domain [Microbacterium keratanolyticum]|uniref:Transcriptional regulator n=1 Tax=Microbacterium keratanolyticum TaxID=67574 RepID=A0A9W6M8L1_9MICO|nr:helix-turn-helix transcriptional regulator [Microbacterium keratanolyticum]MBM7469144.1 transcriptional regulator with XRE-family HTH domain [Microbacterium keratanolyticum]GLK01224.1 transcriptional regulator [Microbacterium keratanolyticum]
MPVPAHRAAFGARVRELRTERGWSQEGFAHRAELDRTYVSGIERGTRNPTLDIIYRLAQALGVPAADLLTR